jgi:hypothetical protein
VQISYARRGRKRIVEEDGVNDTKKHENGMFSNIESMK